MTMAATLPLPRSGDRTAMIAVAVTIVAWASAFPAIRAGLASFGPLELGALRFGVSLLPAAVYLAVKRPALPAIGDLWRFAFGGVGFVALYTALLNFGEMTVSAGAASFIINIAPILTALLAMFALGERFSTWAWVGTFVSFAGIGVIALGEGSGISLDRGALLILGAAVITASNNVVQKPLFKKHAPLTVSMANLVIGGVCLLPFLPSALVQAQAASGEAIAAAIYMGIVPSLIAYGSWSIALSRLPAGRATNYLYCVPPAATLMGIVWLGEVPGTMGIVGGLMALAGVAIVNLRR